MTCAIETAREKTGGLLKAGYGSAEIGLTAVEVLLQVYLLEFYVSVGLDPFAAGAALALAVVWDAISDPLMGVASDRMPGRSSRGKRLLFVGIGAPLTAIAFVFLFQPDAASGSQALFFHLLLWYLLLNTAMTLVIVPYLAMINDLAGDAEDRAAFFGWRLVFSGAGLIFGLSIPILAARQAGVDLESADAAAFSSNRADSAKWAAGILLMATVVAILSVWKASGMRAVQEDTAKLGPASLLRLAWSSLSFRLVVGAFVAISMGRAINGSLVRIFYKGTLRFSEEQVAAALVGLSLTVMAATPLWVWLARRYSKRSLCLWGSVALAVLTAVVYPLMPPEAVGPLVFVVLAGGVAASSVVLLESLFSDVVESDAQSAGASLAGSYYGLWRMATKLARALGLAVSGFLLSAIGYEKGEQSQSEQVYRLVAWGFGPGVAVFFAIGVWLLWRELKRAARES